MAEMIDIKGLDRRPRSEMLIEIAERLPDGKAVEINAVCEELDYSLSPALIVAKRSGIYFRAYAKGRKGGAVGMIANPKTVKQWENAQKKLKG